MKNRMFRQEQISGLIAVFAGILIVASLPQLKAQPPASPGNSGITLGGPVVIEPGQAPVMIHPTVDAADIYHANKNNAGHGKGGGGGSASNNLAYNGGVNIGGVNVGVEALPKVYLVLWGSQWSSDPSGEANILESFYSGVGGSSWANSVTQYCQGVARGTVFCNNAGTPAGNPSGVYGGAWYDGTKAAPSHPTQSQIAAEAVNAAAHFGNTSAGSNTSAQYVIATATNNNSNGFRSQYCAYHSSTTATWGGNVAYTNLPYITDAGASCGANFNGLGPTAGITIVGGHEMAETMTDQFPSTGWTDSGGEEIGDKCAWIASGQGASANIVLKTGTFAVQSLWSNAFDGNAGGCVLSYP
jgi:hypothetical protein